MSKKTEQLLSDFDDEAEASSEAVLVYNRPAQPKGPKVPNLFPIVTTVPYRIAVIGEAPGADEVRQLQPFVGASGRFLSALLAKATVMRQACFIGNVCQYQPPGNDISLFSRSGPEITEGIEQLTADLNRFNPHICLLLGKTALWAAKGTDKITDWRGSFFVGERAPFIGRKCLASYHPAACLRQYEWTPLLMMDIKKAFSEASSPDLVLPRRSLDVTLSLDEIIERLEQIRRDRPMISFDIEGWVHNVTCLSIATDSMKSFIVPFTKLDGTSYWTLDEEVRLWQSLVPVLSDPSIPKVLQNCLYDRFVLHYGLGIVVRGTKDDTMLKFWEQYCELEKGLGFQCSILTREPYYKGERGSSSQDEFFRYCCKDSAVTYEINERLERILTPPQLRHYRQNVALLNPLLYMELRGIRYNKALADVRHSEIERVIYGQQAALDRLAGVGLKSFDNRVDLLAKIREHMCYKRDPTKPKKAFAAEYEWAIRRINDPSPLVDYDIGRLSTACKQHLNVDSPKQVRDFVYNRLKLPVQFADRDNEKVTSDFAAMLKLKKKVDKGSLADKSLDLLIDLGQLSTRRGLLEIKTDPDGRVRTGYNLVGTPTARIASYTSPTGSGYNLQTITSGILVKPDGHPLKHGMRDLFLADDDCYIFQVDLSGADGWTVGAYLNMLGDPTMLMDLRAKLKPAAIICYMLRHGNDSLKGRSREEIRELLKEVKKEDWDYFACKQGIWGTCVTPDHEVLTPNGWWPIDKVTQFTKVAVWDGATGAIRFEQPTNVISQLYTGELFSYEGNAFSLLATADHRMPFFTNNNLKCVTAAQLSSKRGCELPLSGCWQGSKREPNARLVAAIMSDGSYTKDNKLVFTFRKQRKIERIKVLLNLAGISFSETVNYNPYDGKPETRIYCYNAPIYQKRCGAWMLEWDFQSLDEFTDEYANWDGHINPKTHTRTIFSVDKNHLDWFATFCRLANKGYTYQGAYRSGKGSLVHRLSINHRRRAHLNNMKVTTVPAWRNKVYCLTVSTGYFLVRRNDKIMVTGNCYTMGPDKLAVTIAKKSEGAIWLSRSEVQAFQAAVHARYAIRRWHNWMASELKRTNGVLVAPNGFRRKFYGRTEEALGNALAHMPQVITTYATNTAMYRLWTDPENRLGERIQVGTPSICDGSATTVTTASRFVSGQSNVRSLLRVEPLHQVHDALLGQFKRTDTTWAIGKIRQWFDNQLVIAGQPITIPYEGNYGTNWALDKNSKVGDI
jgi:uracil-DNA glycosylase family 4